MRRATLRWTVNAKEERVADPNDPYRVSVRITPERVDESGFDEEER